MCNIYIYIINTSPSDSHVTCPVTDSLAILVAHEGVAATHRASTGIGQPSAQQSPHTDTPMAL